MKLDLSSATTYEVIPKPTSYRTGFLILSPAEYPVSWGTSVAKGPHLRLDEPDPVAAEKYPYYACALQEFIDTYRDVPGQPGTYIKRVTVKAIQLSDDAVVDTLEGPMSVPAGSWVLEDAKGNQWPVAPSVFVKTYKEV